MNFIITNLTEDREIEFGFYVRDGGDGVFSKSGTLSDEIIFLEPDENDSLVATWSLTFGTSDDDSLRINPSPGDILDLEIDKPFLSHDIFEFITLETEMDIELAKKDMDRIKVVPNPYIVANSWEPRNLYSTGRGPRELHFIHLPMECTIRIFNIQGQLVQTLEHKSTIWDGTEIWDMLTKDKLDIAYGVYIYHVEAPGIGEKIGKFAVIK